MHPERGGLLARAGTAAAGPRTAERAGWYAHAVLINLCQAGIPFSPARLELPPAEGFVGSFFFYWWHRVRHLPGFWQVFHQLHHSPARIEALTSFYKHPLEILADSALAALVLYPLFGCSLERALWFNFFAAIGEFFYHSNFRSPPWVRYFTQTPELHSIHHARDVHRYNFSDLPVWDRMFGTCRNTRTFAAECGFPRHNERKLGAMHAFRDVYDD